jgi:integrase
LISEGCHVGYYRGLRVNKWVARYRRPGAVGGYLKRTLGETDDNAPADGAAILNWKQAQGAAASWFDEVARDGRPAGPYTVSDALDAYLAQFKGRSLNDTRVRIEQHIRPALGSIELAELTPRRLKEWHRHRADTPARKRSREGAERKFKSLKTPEERRARAATANRELTILKAALNLAFRDEFVSTDRAWRQVKPFPKVDFAKQRYLSDAEARRLVNSTAAAFRPLVQAALLTGARYGELTAVCARDVDVTSATLRLVETKSGAPRIVYLEAEGLDLFKALKAGKTGRQLILPRPDGGRWGPSQQRRPMIEACAKGKIDPPATFHDLRRTYGARLALKGVPMPVIAEALGHADERITRRHYAHLSPSYVADTVRTNAAGLGIVQKTNVASIEETPAVQ